MAKAKNPILFNVENLGHYRYELGAEDKEFIDIDNPEKYLIWNICRSFSNNQYEVYNIFAHTTFKESLIEIKKRHKTFNDFSFAVRKSLYYYFGGKCEWEIRCRPMIIYNKLESEEIIDAYDQIMINFNIFIQYLWSHRSLISTKYFKKYDTAREEYAKKIIEANKKFRDNLLKTSMDLFAKNKDEISKTIAKKHRTTKR